MSKISVGKKTKIVELARPERRSFLKLLALGGGVFVMGSILSSFGKIKSSNTVSDKKSAFSENFRVVESKKELAFYNKKGDELLIIEKDS